MSDVVKTTNVSVKTLISNVANITPNNVAMDYQDTIRRQALPSSYYTQLHNSTTQVVIMTGLICVLHGHTAHCSRHNKHDHKPRLLSSHKVYT